MHLLDINCVAIRVLNRTCSNKRFSSLCPLCSFPAFFLLFELPRRVSARCPFATALAAAFTSNGSNALALSVRADQSAVLAPGTQLVRACAGKAYGGFTQARVESWAFNWLTTIFAVTIAGPRRQSPFYRRTTSSSKIYTAARMDWFMKCLGRRRNTLLD